MVATGHIAAGVRCGTIPAGAAVTRHLVEGGTADWYASSSLLRLSDPSTTRVSARPQWLRECLLGSEARLLLPGQLRLYAFLMLLRGAGKEGVATADEKASGTPSGGSIPVDDAFWRAYVQWLPSSYSDPLWWGAEVAADLLQGTSLAAAVRQRMESLRTVYVDAFGRVGGGGAEEKQPAPHSPSSQQRFSPNSPTFDQFLWAHSTYTSRSFPARLARPTEDGQVGRGVDPAVPFASGPASAAAAVAATTAAPAPLPAAPLQRELGIMLPFLDLTNHRPNHPIYWAAGQAGDVARATLPPADLVNPTIVVLTPQRGGAVPASATNANGTPSGWTIGYVSPGEIHVGDQVYNNYGPKVSIDTHTGGYAIPKKAPG